MKIYVRANHRRRSIKAATATVTFDDIITMIYDYSRIPSDRWNKGNRYMDVLKQIRSSYYAGEINIREYQDLMNRLQEVDDQ